MDRSSGIRSAILVRAYPGAQFTDFTLKFNADGMLEYETKTTGWASATASTPTPSFSTILPTQVWQGAVTVGGPTITKAMTGEISMNGPVKPGNGIA